MSSAQVNGVVRSNRVSAKHESRLNEMLKEMANENQVDKVAIAARSSAYGIIPNFNNNQAITGSACGTIPNSSNNQAKVRAPPKCSIGNYTPSHVTHDSAQNWAGSVVGSYPNRIHTNAAGGFRTRTVDNSEGAVLYIGTNGDSECAFVLAWQNTRFGKLVYVEAGPSENYASPPWDTIRNRLKEDGGTQSYYKDNETGAEVSAKLGSGSDFIAAAAFDITAD